MLLPHMPCQQLWAGVPQLLEVSSPELKLPRRPVPSSPPPPEEPAADLAEKRAAGCLHGGGQGREEHAPCAQHPGLARGAVGRDCGLSRPGIAEGDCSSNVRFRRV